MGAKLASLSGVLGATQDRGLSFITSSTFSAASSVSVDGCFTASYDNYLLVIDGTCSATNPTLSARMRAASTDNSSATYDYTASYSYTGLATNSTGYGGTSWVALYLGTAGGLFSTRIEVASPALAAYTRTVVDSVNQESASASVRVFASGIHRTATAYDGITLYPSSGTITGTLAIYGYRNA